MPFLLLLGLMAACVPMGDDWPTPFPDRPLLALAATAAAAAGVVGLAAGITGRVRRRLARPGADLDAIASWYAGWRTRHLLILLAAWGGSLYGLGYGRLMSEAAAVPGDYAIGLVPLPGAELLNLVPLVAMLLLSWAVFYGAEAAFHRAADPLGYGRPFWSRGGYVSFQARSNLALLLVPVGLFVTFQGAERWLPGLSQTPWFAVLGLVGMLAGLVTMPWWVRLVFGLKPMPEGPLRDRLDAAARRVGFRCSGVLLWPTRHGVANAMVVGLVPWLRYVLLSDRLIAEMSPDEVEAVFGHEVGHVRHGHMPYYLAFLALSTSVLALAWGVVEAVLPAASGPAAWRAVCEFLRPHQGWLPIAAVGGYVFVVFGFLSRRCERQADLFGCRTVSCRDAACAGHGAAAELAPRGAGLCPTGIRTFISALEKVAVLNGLSRDRPSWLQSWQHSSIAKRVAFLERVIAHRPLERRFQRRLGLFKWALIAVLLAAAGALAAQQGVASVVRML
jgi:Zn-dependent protease with chaperone function